MDAYIRAVAFLSRVAGVAAAFLIGFAVLVICDMVVERYILNLTTIWQIDVVTYCIVGATFIGSAYVLMTRGHVNVDVLPLHLGAARRAIGWRCLPSFSALASVLVLFMRLHRASGTRPGARTGIPTRSGARRCGFRISRCPSVSGCSSCNMSPSSFPS